MNGAPFAPLRFGLGTWCVICAGRRRIVCYPLDRQHVLARRADGIADRAVALIEAIRRKVTGGVS